MESILFFAALLTFLYGLVSGVIARSPISGPMVFVGIGLLVGPLGFDLFEAKIESELVQVVAEVTLIVILFTDASMIRLKALKREYGIPLRLLAIGLPLTMALGYFIALPMFPGVRAT